MNKWCRLIVCACLVGGCNGKDNPGGGGGSLKANIGLDLPHIVGFALSDGTAAASRVWPEATDGGVTSMSTLYAIDDQGNLVGTSITTSTTMTLTPRAIYNTARYVLFGFDNLMFGTTGCNYVILRKSDGALYCSGVTFGPNKDHHVDSDGADRVLING